MNYRIIITKREPNPNYAQELEEFDSKSRSYYDRGMGMGGIEREHPKTEISTDVLITEVTEEQYKKIQAEFIKVF